MLNYYLDLIKFIEKTIRKEKRKNNFSILSSLREEQLKTLKLVTKELMCLLVNEEIKRGKN